MRTRDRLAREHGLTVARALGTAGAFGSQRRYPPQPKPAPAVDVRRVRGLARRLALDWLTAPGGR